MGRFVEFIRDFFGEKDIVSVKEKLEVERHSLMVTTFASKIAIEMIANLVSKCTFNVYENHKESHKDTYYSLNFAPNDFQNGTEFKKKLVVNLLTNNEALIVQVADKFYIAESYDIKHDYLMYPPTYSNVSVENASHNIFTFQKTFTDDNAIYINLHNEKIKSLLNSLQAQYENITAMAIDKYRRSNGRKGILSLNKVPQNEAETLSKLQAGFKNYYNEENGMVLLTNGMTYSEMSNNAGNQGNEISNLQAITKEAFMRASQAYGVPPAILLGEIADASKAVDQLLTFCIEPLVTVIETEFNRKLNGKAILSGTTIDIDISAIKHVDLFDIATSVDKLTASGFSSIDELRKLADLHPLNEEWSKAHWMTKNYANIEKAGEEQ